MTFFSKQKGVKQMAIKMTPFFLFLRLIKPIQNVAYLCKQLSFLIQTRELDIFAHAVTSIIGQPKDFPYGSLFLSL